MQNSFKECRSQIITVRGLSYHLRHWGNADAPTIFMLHGWMDVGASFQFIVDALKHDWHVVAPDWRGFGRTDTPAADCYWFPDYLADLDAIIEQISPDTAVNLVGHSMGANVVMLYAGVRPERVLNVVNLEGYGVPSEPASAAPARYRKWLDELRTPPKMQPYATIEAVAQRLQKTNPRLSNIRANFLAQHWAGSTNDGNWRVLADPAHKISNAVLYRVEEVMACWRNISAPVLWLNGANSGMFMQLTSATDFPARLACIAQLQQHNIDNAGHMLHHDQPEIVANLLEAFLLDDTKTTLAQKA